MLFFTILFIFFCVKENGTNQASPAASVFAEGYAGQDARQEENAHKTRPCGLPCASRKGRAQCNSLALKQALRPKLKSGALSCDARRPTIAGLPAFLIFLKVGRVLKGKSRPKGITTPVFGVA
jgi:hypothetical protein